MNQILSVENRNYKNKRGRGSKSSIRSIVKVFSIILIIFGIGLTSTGAYSYYRSLSTETEKNTVDDGSTKPVITTERENASTINIVVAHDKAIAKLTYKINDGEEIEVNTDNQNEVKEEVELPVGSSKVSITAKDVNGISSSYESSYEVGDKPTIKLEQADGKIKATIESQNTIDYVMYYWDEDEASAKKATINAKTTETPIEVLEGTHTLNVIAVDTSGNQTKKTQKIIGDNKPDLQILTNGKVFRITASDDESLSKIEYTLNTNAMQTEEINDKEYKKDLELENGMNKLEVTVYNKNGLKATTSVEYEKK